MKIIVSGDTHGNIDYHKLTNSSIMSQFGTLPDIVIVAGDFGVPWSNNNTDKQDEYLARGYSEKPYKILVVPGNHENYDRIEKMPITSIYGAKANQFTENIFFIQKNEVVTINKSTFFCFGGAMSSDKMYRIPKISWWSQEDASYGDWINFLEKFKNIQSVDYVITHTCPEPWMKELEFTHHINDKCPTREILTSIEEKLAYRKWFFGHFHQDKIINNGKAQCLYETLIQIEV
jgi:predicted phosphodiesterase